MPTPHFERGTLTEREKDRPGDVFKPPYNPNLYVGELRDEDEGTEYVVLVSEFGFFFAILLVKLRKCEPTTCWHSLVPMPIALDACFVAQQVLRR